MLTADQNGVIMLHSQITDNKILNKVEHCSCFAVMIGSKMCDACFHESNKLRGSMIPQLYRNLEVSGVFEARQQ